MRNLPKIELALFDADDTIWHAYGPWAVCMDPAYHDLVNVLGANPAETQDFIQNKATGQHRFNDYGGLSHFLNAQGLIPRSDDPQEQYERDIIRRNIRSRFFHDWQKQTVFYEGTIGTFRKIKQAGTAIAVWTDSDAPSVIRRYHSACKNAGMITQQMIETLDLFDAFYVMPSHECDSLLLWNIDDELIHAFKRRMVISSKPKAFKPADPAQVPDARGMAIMDDFGAKPENTLMMGDSNKDVFAALQSGIHGVWFKKGANQNAKTVEMLTRFASPRYKYGLENILAELARHAPDENYITIEENIAELAEHFTFAPAPHGYRHSPLSRQCHIPLALARMDQLGLRSRKELYVQFGIATHFGAEIPVIEPQDFAGMADPGIPGSQPEILPA